MGLYCKNIALFLCTILIIYIVLIKYRKTKKYIKRILKIKIIILTIAIILAGYVYVKHKENKFENTYNNITTLTAIIEVKSDIQETEYSKKFTGKIIKCEKYPSIENTKLNINYKTNTKINCGDIVRITGEYEEINSYKNNGTFNYKNYLKKDNIYGALQTKKIEVIKINNNIFYKLNNHIKEKNKMYYSEKTASYLETIILGDKSNLGKEIKEQFSEAGLSHVLAISGMHIAIIILITNKLLSMIIKKKKLKDIILLMTIIIYSLIINTSSSLVRAVIMASLHIISKLVYKKDNFLVNISIASFIILITNPYNLVDTGFQLSFVASIGIVLVSQKILKVQIKNKFFKYICSSLLVSLSANILILPIIIYSFKKISLSMFLIQIIITPILYIIEILGIFSIFIPNNNIIFVKPILEISIQIFDYISQINFFTIYIKVPNILTILIYYFFIMIYILKPKRKFIKKALKKIVIAMIIINLIITLTEILNNTLKIYMIDVGQGDSTLIITPNNKTILVDGGGNESYDIGKNILIPYLLNKQIKTIDYVIVSHFDTDHCGGLFAVVENLKVDTIILGKQDNRYDNCTKFLELAKAKKVKVICVEAGNSIKIDKYTHFEILWPDSRNMISYNGINNNSILAKFVYGDFSMLFTGDIEELAEKEILKKYKNTDILDCNILKVAHHGSKSSSVQEMLEKNTPQIAVIGVGEDNKYGHPNSDVISRLQNLRMQSI